MGFKLGLESLLGRSVDLVEPKAIANPYFALVANQHRALIYAACSAQTSARNEGRGKRYHRLHRAQTRCCLKQTCGVPSIDAHSNLEGALRWPADRT
jgi:hypothetical protein